ncbi:hypothetical protein ACK0NM_03975 [Pseudomonas aeruginosa]|uniref:hypothetical protein n=1 Tax=Pseudomonas aeruginosa TaxID=287 RepID=UPI0039081696
MQQNENFAKQPEQAEAERPELEPHIPAQTIAEAAIEQLIKSGAKHYQEFHFDLHLDGHEGARPVVVTVAFSDGPSAHELRMKAEQERDAALARVAELTPTRNRYGVDAHYFNKNLQRILRDFESFTTDELARSLIILAKVADEKVVAQAQHSVPEEFSFEYRHPNGECHTVTVSREQVINEMPDFLFEALCSKFCNCEPVGETNVVECCCDEYAEEFKLIASAPGKEGL